MSAWHDRIGRRKEKVALAVLTKERREGEEAERHFLFPPPQFFMPKNLLLLRPPGTLVMRVRKCTETKGTIQQRRNVEFLIVCRRKMESRVQPKKLIARCGPCEEEGGAPGWHLGLPTPAGVCLTPCLFCFPHTNGGWPDITRAGREK